MSRARAKPEPAAPSPTDALSRLRALRVREAPDLSMGAVFAIESKHLERARKRTGGAAKAWCEVCPPDLLRRTAIVGLTRGVLTISVRDASTRYELDRLLRSGAETELLRRSAAPVRRVKLVVETKPTNSQRKNAVARR